MTATSSRRNIIFQRKKRNRNENLEKYHGVKEELKKIWKVKTKVIPLMLGALRTVTSKLEKWLQYIPRNIRTTSEISVQRDMRAKIKHSLKLPDL